MTKNYRLLLASIKTSANLLSFTTSMAFIHDMRQIGCGDSNIIDAWTCFIHDERARNDINWIASASFNYLNDLTHQLVVTFSRTTIVT
jgi:hypothetical protein